MTSIDVQIINAVSKKPEFFPQALRNIAEEVHDGVLDNSTGRLADYKIALELFDEAYDKITKSLPPDKKIDFNIFYKAWEEASKMYDRIAEILDPVVSGDWMSDYYDDIEDVEPEMIEDDWQLAYEDALEIIKTEFGKYVAEAVKKNIDSIVLELGGGASKINRTYMDDIGTDFIDDAIEDKVIDAMYSFVGDYNNKNIKFKVLEELLRAE